MPIPTWDSKLVAAIEADDLARVEALVRGHEHRLDTTTKDRRLPFLSIAAARSSLGVIRRLIELGANPNTAPDTTALPVESAVRHGHATVLRVLVDSGAELHTHRLDAPHLNQKLGPYASALARGRVDVVAVFLDHGFDVDRFENWSAQTPLALAAEEGHAALVELLLEHGAAVDGVRADGRTPLHAAIVFNLECFEADRVDPRAHARVVEALLLAGADPRSSDGRETVVESARRLGDSSILGWIDSAIA